MKIAVFGSAFNPPTRGHEDAVRYVLETLPDVGQVLLVPSFKHAFAKQMSDYEVRVEMLRAFVDDLNDVRVQARPIEHQIASPTEPVYTFDLLTHLQQEIAKDDELCFVIGPDNAQNWDRFHKAQQIKRQWQLVTVPERKAIRSTQVRRRLEQGQDASDLLTPSVNAFLDTHPIYA